MRTAFKFLLVYLGLSFVVGLVLIGLSYPDVPNSAGQWIMVFLAPIPLYLAFELVGGFVGEWLHDNRATRYVERKTAGKSFSWFRILYNLVYFLFLTGLFLGAAYLWRVFGQS